MSKTNGHGRYRLPNKYTKVVRYHRAISRRGCGMILLMSNLDMFGGEDWRERLLNWRWFKVDWSGPLTSPPKTRWRPDRTARGLWEETWRRKPSQ